MKGERVAYLYGDSTESPLEFNYIEFLRDALDFAVEILVADHRIQGLQRGVEERKRLAESELDQLRQLSEHVMDSLDAPAGGPEAPAGRCAEMIRQAADDAIRRTAAQIKQSVSDYQLQVSGQVQRERQSSMRALEILRHHRDLPDSAQQAELVLDQSRTGYCAQTRGKSDLGVDWLQTLDIPAGHMLSQAIKVERISPGLEIRVPEKGGWMRKGMRMRSHRIASEYITEVQRTALQTTIKLRSSPEDDETGYNLLITAVEPRIRLVRLQKGGEHTPPFEPVDGDVPLFLDLASQLTDAVYELVANRGALVEARLDGTPLGSHENPPLLVKRLIAKMAPAVQEIARHSLSPEELVLKRVLADDRREEIFASKADLLGKLDPVPLALRGVFAPLGLGDLGSGRPGDLGSGRPAGVDVSASAGPPPAPVPSKPNRAAGSIPPPPRATTVELDAETKEIRLEGGGAAGARRAAGEGAGPGAAPGHVTIASSGKAAEIQSSSAHPGPASNGRTTAPQGAVGLAATAAATAAAAALSAGRRSAGPTKPPPASTQPGLGTHPPPVSIVPRPDAGAAGGALADGARARRESAAPGAPDHRAQSQNDDEDVTIVAEASGPRGANGAQTEDSIDVALGELEAETIESH